MTFMDWLVVIVVALIYGGMLVSFFASANKRR